MDKQCTACGRNKPLDSFWKQEGGKYGRQSRCKRCATREHRRWRKAKKKADPFHDTRHHFKYQYGITLEEYDELLIEQDGCCAICDSDNPFGKGRFHVDHDHETGQVRGLLCHHCNLGLGQFQDDMKLLRQAIKYLKDRR